jgi:hypothetical protein
LTQPSPGEEAVVSTHAEEPSHGEETREVAKERLEIHKLLAANPNYFGTLEGSDFDAVESIKLDTSYEELTCVGLWPERNLLEATLVVKRPKGFRGGPCTRGSHEYVRFFIDWNGDGDFLDFNEDAGVASVNVHDIPQVKKHHLCYAVRRQFRPLLAHCKEPYIVKVRAILSWEIVPTGPSFIPIWGNVLECWIQIDPVRGKVIGLAEAPDTATDKAAETHEPRDVPRERVEFLELVEKNPNYFGTLAGSTLPVVEGKKYDTTFEELKCIGLYPEANFLEAVLQVKLPYGFLGDLCTGGSREYVRFFIDWNGDGDFLDFNEDAGLAYVNVHDIPQAREFHLCYALGRRFRALQRSCKHPYIVKVRAILSWQVPPTGPNFVPVWGNVVECWVQIRPTTRPPRVLTARIDSPGAGACVQPAPVPACTTAGMPLVGIEIIGEADGGPFDHYTLRYSWSGGPVVDNAVVYPNCSRPPGTTSSTTAVVGGTLGWLDVNLLPPGETEFTVYLDVFDAAAGSLSVSRTFKLKTEAVQITEAATVGVVEHAEDPFHLTHFANLIKSTNDPDPSVPEVSIGGAFSVTGSAYVVGCDRILSQYNLVRFDAPPAAVVPTFTDATGGSGLIPAPVVYDGTPPHPWSSGCWPTLTPNIVLNGNLVAQWSTDACSFFGFPYTVPKVKPLPFFNSGPLNGRFVILVEAQDAPVASGPSAVAGVDQIAVWIDNQSPTALITKVGGLLACQDLHLKDYVGTTAEVRGIAWDPPIVATVPQQRPNDNFGTYSMSFQKNGGAGGSIAPATPATRVPNTWPGPLAPGADGVLANWDIVAALDGGPPPLPVGSEKLARGERCAYVIGLSVSDTTHVGDSGIHHTATALYAITIINDIP